MSQIESDDREQHLRDAVVAGQVWAWTELYDASYEALWGYVYWRTGRVHEWTEEVVQQTWLVAVRQIRSFEPRRGRFNTCLRGIADRVVKSQLRRWLIDQRALRARGVERDVMAAADEAALRREEALCIAQALAAISPDYERVLRAKYFDQQRVVEIAAAEGTTPKAIESRLTRARQAFAQAYAQFLDLAGSPRVPNAESPSYDGANE
jgi:RNA polymerase sigma-70 factor (ECF subfamily)